ncbi:protein ubiquitination [Pleodorina starrii]|uniref:Protein ubiquitination n=1 Tax=Pleodorina starrii TaxID=330485 RepID=A0A9W6F1M7_9CHLO|nr:protein ubiquitination [Pleodorina starrii]GLC52336.1 protein ubiquitination [Pleodorina starrii]GLC67993.1 protein ubiquitination [Pleodorina starrii]
MESGKVLSKVPLLCQLASQLGMRNPARERTAFDEHASQKVEGAREAGKLALAAASAASPASRAAYLQDAALRFQEASESQAAQKQVHDMSELLGFKETVRVLHKGNPQTQTLLGGLAALDTKQRKRLISGVTGGKARLSGKKRSKQARKRSGKSRRRHSSSSSSSSSSSDASSSSSSSSDSSDSEYSGSDGGRRRHREKRRSRHSKARSARGRGGGDADTRPKCFYCKKRGHRVADCKELDKLPEGERAAAAAQAMAAGRRPSQRRN